MSIIFKSTEGDYLEAEIEIDGQPIYVMDEFGGEQIKPDSIVSLEIFNSFSDELEWDSVFSANPDRKKKLEHINSWSYFALGEVISINPMICDCGILKLEGPFETNDERCIGEFVGFRVTRLTAFGT